MPSEPSIPFTARPSKIARRRLGQGAEPIRERLMFINRRGGRGVWGSAKGGALGAQTVDCTGCVSCILAAELVNEVCHDHVQEP